MSWSFPPPASSLHVSKDDLRLNPCLCHSPSSWHKWILHADPETFVKATFFHLNSELSAMAVALQASETLTRGRVKKLIRWFLQSLPKHEESFLKCGLLELINFCFNLRKQHEIASKMRNLISNTTEYTPLFHSFLSQWRDNEFFKTVDRMVGLGGSGLTQMRGLWRCPERLSYALAVESGMCSGTETVFSTGLRRISVHLDNRVVRSLGWHSVDQWLTHGSGSSLGVNCRCYVGLEFGVSQMHKSRRQNLMLLTTARSASWERGGGQSAAWRMIVGWRGGLRGRGYSRASCIWSQFGVHS